MKKRPMRKPLLSFEDARAQGKCMWCGAVVSGQSVIQHIFDVHPDVPIPKNKLKFLGRKTW
jgi:hypothetical protein